MNKHLSALIFAIAIVSAAIALSIGYANRTSKSGNISVTGLGKEDFTSDLIVWGGSFSQQDPDLKEAYLKLEKDKKKVITYLKSKGIENIIFNAVEAGSVTEPVYDKNGRYASTKFVAHSLSQSLSIESNDVEEVEAVSREITELLYEGINFNSYSPRYYYTKLGDLKIKMISKATEDARIRAETIATNSKGKLGNLQNAKMGIFQITGQNSNEDYSWGGAFNTSSKEKTASITMKLNYEIE